MAEQFHRPSDLECLRFEVELQQRRDRFVVMETARRLLCCYSADPCDCKYGVSFPILPATEATGCPEIRDLIMKMTGWRPYNSNPNSTPEEHAEIFVDRSREAWLRFYDETVEEWAQS